MNKLLVILFCFSISNVFSQIDSTASIKIPSLKQGDVVVDLYYGAPNFYSNLIDIGGGIGVDINDKIGAIDLSTKSLGPLGGRVEKMVTPYVGVCGEFNYAYTSVNLTRTLDTIVYKTTIELPRYRVMVGGNFYFLNTSKINMYVGARLGYSHHELKFPSNDPFIKLTRVSYTIPIPITGRLAIGFRYFFIPNLGMSVELGGLGGGLINAGLCAKF